MSYSTIINVWPRKKHEHGAELSNSHGTAPILWNYISEKVYADSAYWLLKGSRDDSFWKNWENPNLSVAIRALFMFTFDGAYVVEKDYPRFSKDIWEALREMKVGHEKVNHWEIVRGIIDNGTKSPAIGLYCTSVSECPFCGEWSEKKEKYLDQPGKWWNVYKQLDEKVKSEPKKDIKLKSVLE